MEDRGQKTVVSIAVPALLAVVLPLVDYSLLSGRIAAALEKFLLAVMGLSAGPYPFLAVLFFLTLSAVFAGLGFLLVRRAPIKD